MTKGEECGQLIAGKNPTNMKAHVSRHHPTMAAQLQDEDYDTKAKKRPREEEGKVIFVSNKQMDKIDVYLLAD